MIEEKWMRLERYISDLMQDENIAGAAVAISQHGQVLYAKGLDRKSVVGGKSVDIRGGRLN